jgi:hypothetical protein
LAILKDANYLVNDILKLFIGRIEKVFDKGILKRHNSGIFKESNLIIATNDLKKYLSLFATQKDACDHLEMDAATLSKMANGHDVSSSTIAKVLEKTGFDFEKAFEVKE